jgi:sulfur carrier protein
MQNSITLSLNGQSQTYRAPLSVSELLGLLELDTRKVAVERNEEIVPRSVYPQTWLQGGDQLEIVHFIGGG